ncbi:MAG: efflux RND transporter periplasmic adaptor subunit [Spirochaetia bacterium]|nr:efflux RND transporter periplasmic adaptor subunit [Spirochaetia bacterium]
MNIRKLILAALAATLVFAGCTKKQSEINTKSMAQLYAEDGVPVNTVTIKTENFRSYLNFDVTVNGIEESTASAKLSDSVEKILYSVGDIVKKDAVVIQFPKNNISANYYQCKTAFENAEITFKRMAALYDASGISKQDYDNAKTQYEAAKANWNNVREMVNVPAPISGTITQINVRETDNVKAGDILFTVSTMDKLKGKIWIQEKDISKVQIGDAAEATWNGNTVTGKITQLDMSLNQDRQAFGAVAEFSNPDSLIPSGVNAKISLTTIDKPNSIVVERKNITFKNDRTYVFVVEDNKAVLRDIKTGDTYNNYVEITDGLKAGENLITEGNKNVSDGALIRVIAQE